MNKIIKFPLFIFFQEFFSPLFGSNVGSFFVRLIFSTLSSALYYIDTRLWRQTKKNENKRRNKRKIVYIFLFWDCEKRKLNYNKIGSIQILRIQQLTLMIKLWEKFNNFLMVQFREAGRDAKNFQIMTFHNLGTFPTSKKFLNLVSFLTKFPLFFLIWLEID